MHNTITASPYLTLDATLAYTFHPYTLSLNTYNLTNRRDPVLQSELGEHQFYPLPARRLFLNLSVPL